METFVSKKGKPLLLFDGYPLRMTHVQKHSNDIFWRCCENICRFRVVTNINNCVKRVKYEHCHERPKEVKRDVMRNEDKQKAVQEMLGHQSQKRKRSISSLIETSSVPSSASPISIETSFNQDLISTEMSIQTTTVNPAEIQDSKRKCFEAWYYMNYYNSFVENLNEYIRQHISLKVLRNEPVNPQDLVFVMHYQGEFLAKFGHIKPKI